MPLTVRVVWLPALSVTVAVAERLSPAPLMRLSAGQSPAMPDSVSEQLQCTVTSPLYQPLPFGAVVAAPVRVGAVLSMLMGLIVALWLLPASSYAVPAADWLPPSLRLWLLGQLAMPEVASPQVQPTVTSS